MSREQAHRRATVRRERAVCAAWDAGPLRQERPVVPLPPLLTAHTDEAAGVIHARGSLDGFGAGVLCRIVDSLRELGHRQIAVRLGAATVADEDARALLADRARELRSDGVRLLVE